MNVFDKMRCAEDFFSRLGKNDLMQRTEGPTLAEKFLHPVYSHDLSLGKKMLEACQELVVRDPKHIDIPKKMKQPFMDYLLYLIDNGKIPQFKAAFEGLDFNDAELFFHNTAQRLNSGFYVSNMKGVIETFVKKHLLDERVVWANELAKEIPELKPLLEAHPKLIFVFNRDRDHFMDAFKKASIAKQLSFFDHYFKNNLFGGDEALKYLIYEGKFSDYAGDPTIFKSIASLVKGNKELEEPFKVRLQQYQRLAYNLYYPAESSKSGVKADEVLSTDQWNRGKLTPVAPPVAKTIAQEKPVAVARAKVNADVSPEDKVKTYFKQSPALLKAYPQDREAFDQFCEENGIELKEFAVLRIVAELRSPKT